MIRKPAVAGYFYPSNRNELLSLISSFHVQQSEVSCQPIGVVVPHAGIVYSGRTAMYSYNALRNSSIRDFIIIGPNHRPMTPYASIFPSGSWETPLGNAIINEELASELYKNSQYIVKDEESHSVEHSIEVQIPFLQYMFGNSFTFVPVILGDQEKVVANDIASALMRLSKPYILIASSDFTHYERSDIVERKDMDLISRIVDLDIDGFYDTIERENVTACGYGAIAILMIIAKKIGAKISLLNHSNSGDVTNDYDEVVGYSSIVACRQI
ncbi:hypothetical protein [Thermoplasma volcanium GSS1]|uniref:MEMO1 family protein TV1383 n=1 Tax=Thermoplasma volcanium (strain ATCC 51530 / DSM 4299 / JCM 9571 / NBRC 15438 / GSS1) TaxID=273116 RepID=Y1383_THEVO|nr:MEMO1 family protein [Thermoplasma volcanium]Q978N2.1 RecName: Full=MEMO1 family protein TV1383 [Thermoplasma volcanium GSS1]BAB60525.1 hypothetical protein [Thermoplasma volcanium GSS1]